MPLIGWRFAPRDLHPPGVGFFDRITSDLGPDDDPDIEAFEDPTSPWIGGVVAAELVLARSEQAAVVLTSIVTYPDSFAFTVQSYLHRSVKPKNTHRGLAGWGWRDVDDDTADLPDGLLRLGLVWPDGGQATNIDTWRRGWPSPDETAPSHGLEEHGGSGSDREYRTEFHAWPVPEVGDLTFIVEWPRYGIPETRAILEGTLLRDAASRARPVWEGDEDRAPPPQSSGDDAGGAGAR